MLLCSGEVHWRWPDDPDKIGYTQWSVFDAKTDYLNPSKKDYMINFRVEHIEELVEELKSNGMEVIGDIESFDYGKFAWVMDPEGNKVELWESVDEVFATSETSALVGTGEWIILSSICVATITGRPCS